MLFDDLANCGRKNSKDTALMVTEHIEIENYKPNSTFANWLDLSFRPVQGSPGQSKNYTIKEWNLNAQFHLSRSYVHTLDIPPPVNKRYRLSRFSILVLSKVIWLSVVEFLWFWSSSFGKKALFPHRTEFWRMKLKQTIKQNKILQNIKNPLILHFWIQNMPANVNETHLTIVRSPLNPKRHKNQIHANISNYHHFNLHFSLRYHTWVGKRHYLNNMFPVMNDTRFAYYNWTFNWDQWGQHMPNNNNKIQYTKFTRNKFKFNDYFYCLRKNSA